MLLKAFYSQHFYSRSSKLHFLMQ